MTETYRFTRGRIPLLVSSPHSGTRVPDGFLDRLTPEARLLPDTDWHIPALYDFADDLGASRIEAVMSRYVIDLNRPPDGKSLYPGQESTGLCPVQLFDGGPVYRDDAAPDEAEIAERRERYWAPYHARLADELARLRDEHGYALLYDCHSIRAVIPRLFDGRLPTLNLGTARGASCAAGIERALSGIVTAADFPAVVNGRFVGGYITRHYGDPANDIHAIQMEITQADYMDEAPPFPYRPERAARLKSELESVMQAFIRTAKDLYRR